VKKRWFVQTERDPRLNAIPDIHGHAKGEHKAYSDERPLPLTARMLFLWFYHACRRGHPRFLMVTDHMNFLTFEDPASVNLVRRALKLAQAGDLYGAAETASVDVGHAQVVSEGLRRGMRYSIGAEVDNDPRARPDAQNIVEAMRPDGLIRSVHFLPIDHPVHGPNWQWPFDNPEFVGLYDHVGTEKTWEIYMSVLLDALERLPGNIVGHFYVPAVFGHWPDDATLERYEDQMLDIVEARGMAVEFNTRFLYRDHTEAEKERFLAANRRLLRKAKERGVGIAIGSDAHSPRDQGSSFDVVLALLDELEINELVFPIAGRLLRVALRYVKPPVPEPPPPPPLPPPAPEPEPALVEVAETVPAAAPVAAPVRKARPAASSSRSKETAPERPPDRPAAEAPDSEAPPPPVRSKRKAAAAEPAPAPESPAPDAEPLSIAPPPKKTVAARAKAAPGDATPSGTAPDVEAGPQEKPAQPPAAKSAAAPAVTPAAAPAPKGVPAKKTAPAPAAKPAVKPPAKAPPKLVPKAKAAAKKTPAKAPAKKAPAKKSAPASPPSHTKAPVKKAPAKKTPVKKVASKAARPAAKKATPPKKAAPAKKATVKKPPAKKAAPKKAPAKKAPPKKSAAKRR
jgi:HisJ family histidinol phosphate phosphatase